MRSPFTSPRSASAVARSRESEAALLDADADADAAAEDDALLARLGYRQELTRGLALFESWAATFSNFVSGLPILFGWVMVTGGPQAALTSWTLVSIVSCLVAVALAELAAALPTAGGLFFWTYRLGGRDWGPFLSWMTAWWNWSAWVLAVPGTQQGATLFLISALQINYPDAAVLDHAAFSWLLIVAGLVLALLPSLVSQRWLKLFFRLALGIFFVLLAIFWICFPLSARGRFQPGIHKFHNGINKGPHRQASDAYCRLISLLFGAWEFGGYDASVLLAEETKNASKTVARGMWLSTLTTTICSIPTLVLILLSIQDFEALISAPYANNWAEFLIQLIGPRAATAVLLLNWIDCTCATASVMLAAQRVTYAISRHDILTASPWLRKVDKTSLVPVNAALMVFAIAVGVSCTVLVSSVAFGAITATTVICQSTSYLLVLLTRHTIGRATFQSGTWNLGRCSPIIGLVAISWLVFLCIILLLPQEFPVTLRTLNYSPICLVLVTVLSLSAWFLPVGRGGRTWFQGPDKTPAE